PTPTPTPTPIPTPTPPPTPTFIAVVTPTIPPIVGAPTIEPTAGPTVTAPPPAGGPLPTIELPSIFKPGEKPYVAPPPTFLEKLIPARFQLHIFVIAVFVLIPLLYLSPFIYLAKTGIGHVLFLIEKMRTTAGVSPPAPLFWKLIFNPRSLISLVLAIAILILMIFVPPFSNVFKLKPVPSPVAIISPSPRLGGAPAAESPSPGPVAVFSPTPFIIETPAAPATATPVAVISPTPLPTPPEETAAPTASPSPALTLTPTPTAVAIFSPTLLPTPAGTATATPPPAGGPTATPITPPAGGLTPTPLPAPPEFSPAVSFPTPSSFFAPIKDFYRRAVSPDYRWLLYLIAAIWCAILALLPFLTFLTKFSGKLGILTKKIV
ncbi:MAG: hypothetical protein Q8L57_00880, partial [bacterium]|nr:hypothetical protein [bacterium]